MLKRINFLSLGYTPKTITTITALLLTSCVTTDRSDLAHVGGINAKAGELPSVFLLGDYCTATKIGPKSFVTAAHCVLNTKTGVTELDKDIIWLDDYYIKPGEKEKYSFQRYISNPKTEIKDELKVTKYHIHPSLQQCLDRGNCIGRMPLPDIVIVDFEAPKNSDLAKAPISKFDYRWIDETTTNPKKEAYLTVNGYGCNSELCDRSVIDLKWHRSLVSPNQEMIDLLNKTTTVAKYNDAPDMTLFYGVKGPLAGPQYSNLGSGDSGGSVFFGPENKIVGINVDGFCPPDNEDCQVTNNSFFLRINTHSRKTPFKRHHGIGEWLQSLGY